MPDEVAAWFAGQAEIPWQALLEPDRRMVGAWWGAWLADRPGATPPADRLPGQFPT